MIVRFRLTLVLVLMLPFATASACPPPGSVRACDVLFDDFAVRTGLVVAVVHPVCDPMPQSHVMKASMETAVGGTWIPIGRSVVTDTVPDEVGFDVELSAECREGTYRVRVHVEGAGPRTGNPFVFDDTGPERTFALVECAG